MTLIELLIVFVIFGLLVGILIWNFDRYKQNDNLRSAAENLAQDIRTAQTNAFSGKTVQVGTDESESVPIGGYGVHFDIPGMGDNKYLIFADRERYTAMGCETIRDFRYNYGYCSDDCTEDTDNSDYALPPPVISLPKDIVISKIEFAGIPDVQQQIVDITFFPPQSRVRLGREVPCGITEVIVDNVEITLTHNVTGLEKIVKVIGASGQISVISGTSP